MQPFDEDYLARREKQIQELFELRAMIWACLVTGVIASLIAVALLSTGNKTLGAISLAVSLLFGVGSIFMIASYFAQKATDRAVQKEYELLALYGLPGEKAKRGNQEIRLADDGEIVVEHGQEDEISYREGQNG
ncbi:MAG: hypothetical protein AB1435_07910 [Chloroflexota bacterium]|jgi:choline-glycine betaine transporter